jgi:CheY-like chemotaxis protein
MLGWLHDVANCLTTILGLASVDAGSIEGPEAVDRRLKTIRLAAEDAALLLKRANHLDDAGADAGRRVVRLEQLVQAMPDLVRPRWRQRAERTGTHFDITVRTDEAPPVSVAEGEIRDLLLNLLFNAIDAMPAGGRITLSTRTIDDWAEVSVTDEGVGMSEAVLDRAFEPFFTTKGPNGSGLGLSSCRSIARRHGGVLTAESRPGDGSTFTLRLPPAAPGAVVEGEATWSTGRREGASLRVVLVDDRDDVRETVASMLEALGHGVVAVRDGFSALEAVSRQRVDAVITDVGMPGLNGAELARRLQLVAPDLPVVLMTGGADGTDAAALDNVRTVLGKPVTLGALDRVLAACRPGYRAGNGGSSSCS